MKPSVETTVSFLELGPNGVLLWRYKKGAVVDLPEAQEEAKAIDKLLDEHWHRGVRLCIDISEMTNISRAARRFFSSDETQKNHKIEALALVMGSPIGTMIGNLFHAINRTKHPTRLFNDKDSATLWLEEQLQ